jgi:ABC-type uncharacterized transport system, permease component
MYWLHDRECVLHGNSRHEVERIVTRARLRWAAFRERWDSTGGFVVTRRQHHNCVHAKDHNDSRDHAGDHAHALTHDHCNGQTHSHPPAPGGIKLRDLAAMGVSGGLFPCPEALGIMVIATGLNHIFFTYDSQNRISFFPLALPARSSGPPDGAFPPPNPPAKRAQ